MNDELKEGTSPEEQTEEQPQPYSILDLAAIFFNQGAMALGAMPNPVNGQVSISFEAAQESIELLQVIKDKTTGNLTDEEDRHITTMLDQLKMAFVHATQDPRIREAIKRAQDEAQAQQQGSKIVTPEGRPASSNSESSRIIIP